MAQSGEILVEVDALSKKFSRDLRRSFWFGLVDIMNALLGRRRKDITLRRSEFWAVRDVNFSLRRGECLGLIGRNGAGKSTLLKMLNGLIVPDEGSIVMRGKIGALIELGAGFNPVLTGRENIFNNGQLLGLSAIEIEERIPAILEFAEIGSFIDSPVQNYSSGMKVRLGFAIAAQMKPDVLIIDEVLAVGDLGFVLKCFNTIDKLLEKTAVIFVSHNMPQVSRICSKILYMEGGQMKFISDNVAEGIDLYYSGFAEKTKSAVVYVRNNEAELLSLSFGNEVEIAGLYQIRHLGDLQINIRLKILSKLPSVYVTLTVYDKEQRPVGICLNHEPLSEKYVESEKEGFSFFVLTPVLPRINLSKGIYYVAITLTEERASVPIFRVQGAGCFQVLSEYDVWPPVEFEVDWSGNKTNHS